jgi:hypothetical protein
MKHALTITTAVAVLAGFPAGAAHAAEDSPVPGGTHCEMHPKPSYRQSAVLDRGVPVRVSCDGPATFHVGLEYDGRKVEDAILQLFPESDPGMAAFTKRPVTLAAAGSATARLWVWPWARRLARRFPVVKGTLFLATKREDGDFVSDADDRGRTRLVRR